MLKPFRILMVIISRHCLRVHIQEDIVEPIETGAVQRLDAVIGHQKLFLPAHKDARLAFLVKLKLIIIERILVRFEFFKTHPVPPVNIFVSRPFPRQKAMLSANNLGFKEGGQIGVVFRKALDVQVAAQRRICQIYVLNDETTHAHPTHT